MPILRYLDAETGEYLPADMPSGLHYVTQEQLAAATRVYYSGGRQDADAALTADAYYQVAFDAAYPQFTGTYPAAALDMGTGIWTVLRTGLYNYEIAFDVMHSTVGTGALFHLRLNRSAGVIAATESTEQQVTGWSQRIKWDSVEYFEAGETYTMEIRPVGSGETGWTMTYARHVLWSA